MFVEVHVNLLHIYVSTYPKMITDAAYLTVTFIYIHLHFIYILTVTVTFAATVNVVLEDTNNCLPNNK